jgi:hypothetical protein
MSIHGVYLMTEFVFDELLVVWLRFLKYSDEGDEDKGLKEFEFFAREKFNEFVIGIFVKLLMFLR